MYLHEIITANEAPQTAINTEEIIKYKKSLLTYYSEQFCEEPILMITSVFNACSYAKIVPASELNEAVCAYLEVLYIEQDENEQEFNEDLFSQFETINFNSIFLKQL
jgi:hypothetical protein